jgi:hypothetical protein
MLIYEYLQDADKKMLYAKEYLSLICLATLRFKCNKYTQD